MPYAGTVNASAALETAIVDCCQSMPFCDVKLDIDVRPIGAEAKLTLTEAGASAALTSTTVNAADESSTNAVASSVLPVPPTAALMRFAPGLM